MIGGTHEDAIEVDPALLASAFVVVEERPPRSRTRARCGPRWPTADRRGRTA
ncbi:hypothetical protein SAZ11_56360 [Streptomyces sp. FXJ1.4098]|nr:hypothetical protein [Streptomyces sp. FXJ1.4098]